MSSNAYIGLWRSHGCEQFVRSPTDSFAYGLLVEFCNCVWLVEAGISVSGHDMSSNGVWMTREQHLLTSLSVERTVATTKPCASELQKVGVSCLHACGH